MSMTEDFNFYFIKELYAVNQTNHIQRE